MKAILDGTHITANNIIELFNRYIHDEKDIGVLVSNMYDLSYTKPFSLYAINASSKDREPYSLLGYSYGAKYNRSNENDPLTPKVFYLDIQGKTLEVKFYKNNLVARFVQNKDIGRDSYYVSHNQCILSGNAMDIIQEILHHSSNIYLGSSLTNYSTDGLDLSQQKKLFFTPQLFSQITGFHNAYAYHPFLKITLEDIFHDTDNLLKKQQELMRKKVGITDIDELAKIRNEGGNILPVLAK